MCDESFFRQDIQLTPLSTGHHRLPTRYHRIRLVRNWLCESKNKLINRDILARRALWSDGLDYRHSTSHGVGSFLNVHEGPQGVGQRIQYNDVALVSGMVISNEPGYYADGKFGIRIENIDVIKLSQTRENFGGKEYLELERVTMVSLFRHPHVVNSVTSQADE